MVGGSVSGKTFKPDPSSYEATGIPCGNPCRYKNRSVMRMIPDKSVPYESQQLGAPGKGTKTEAEEHLQDMLKMQLDTNVSLISASKKRKMFTQPVVYNASQASGVQTLDSYNRIHLLKQKEAELSHLGLTKDEIKIKMVDCGFLSEDSTRSNYGINPDVEKDKRFAIQEKIEQKKRSLSELTTFSNVRRMSRHAMEVENSLNRGTEKSMTFSHLVHSRRKFDPALDAVLNEYNDKLASRNTNIEETSGASRSVLAGAEKEEEQLDACSKRSGRIIPLDEEFIKRHRLTLDEIRAIPRFKDYEPGCPSEVLFIKNLSKKVTEADLHALFNRYREASDNDVHIRLMTGRMRGQAFVAFKDKKIAIEALNLVNGFQLYGRTVVIAFGKSIR